MANTESCPHTAWKGWKLTQRRWREAQLVAARHSAQGVGAEAQRASSGALHQRHALVAQPAARVGQDGGVCGAGLVAQHTLGGAAGGLQQAPSGRAAGCGFTGSSCYLHRTQGHSKRGQPAAQAIDTKGRSQDRLSQEDK